VDGSRQRDLRDHRSLSGGRHGSRSRRDLGGGLVGDHCSLCKRQQLKQILLPLDLQVGSPVMVL
jgi:hypothetical protein